MTYTYIINRWMETTTTTTIIIIMVIVVAVVVAVVVDWVSKSPVVTD